LTKRKNANGSTTLTLDYRHGGKRYREFLKHLQLCKPANPANREFNKRNLQLAETIRIAKAAELQGSDYNIKSTINNNE
jgi:hypothetical protein